MANRISETPGELNAAVEPVSQLSRRANGSGVDVYGVDTVGVMRIQLQLALI
jgi:hypothetical protein